MCSDRYFYNAVVLVAVVIVVQVVDACCLFKHHYGGNTNAGENWGLNDGVAVGGGIRGVGVGKGWAGDKLRNGRSYDRRSRENWTCQNISKNTY